MTIPPTPAAQWRADGKPDPHGKRYDTERAELMLGQFSDDELANGAYMNYDQRLSVDDLVNPKEGQYPPLIWMTAVKDRIRWLSRKVEALLRQTQAIPAMQFDGTEASAKAILAWAEALPRENPVNLKYVVDESGTKVDLWAVHADGCVDAQPGDWAVRINFEFHIANAQP